MSRPTTIDEALERVEAKEIREVPKEVVLLHATIREYILKYNRAPEAMAIHEVFEMNGPGTSALIRKISDQVATETKRVPEPAVDVVGLPPGRTGQRSLDT